MSEWKARRFWKSAEVREAPDGFGVSLDGRPVKTPAKRDLLVPTRAFAEAVAAEWDTQEQVINPLTMPFTRSANAALDKVFPQHGEVAEMLAAYGDSDLLCYRAQHPQELVARQAQHWDPVLDWAANELGARLQVHAGVMHQAQDPQMIRKLAARVHSMTAFQLTGFHDLVALSGSLILGFAATCDFMPPKAIWEVSRLDEIWQSEEWGKDEDAEAAALIKQDAFLHARQVFALSSE